ncbi:MAG: hypothetical protein COB60_12100 [Flavobacteriaceae bacterium]|nr:MAG: hypothetical protein COB60_12100 [Flavobacteriaceae bacterium]
MKKTLVCIGFLLGLSFGLSAQNIKLSTAKLKNVLCKQWKIDYSMMGGMRIGELPGAPDFDFNFKSDGHYDLIREDGNNESGIWFFNYKKKFVELAIEGKVTSRIKSIKKDKFVLIFVVRDEDHPGLLSVEVHFKPI